MNVLSVIHYPVFGGPHNRNCQVAPLLRAQGINTLILLPDGPGNAAERMQATGLAVVQTPLGRIRTKYNLWLHGRYFFGLWKEVGVIRKLIRENAIDVVQINGLLNPHGAIAAKLEQTPVVWQILDTFPPMFLRRLLMPLVQRLANVIMCTGEKVASEHPGATSDRSRLITFFPPVNLASFTPDPATRQAARKELGFGDEEIVIGNVSNVNPMKGHIWFIRGAAIVKRSAPRTRFIILGAVGENGGEYFASLTAEASRLGLRVGTDIVFLDPKGRVSHLESAFDIFWMTPEPQSEGIPTVIEEAMALGLPVVAADVGSVSEIVGDGVTGFVVPVRNPEALAHATERLLGDGQLMKTFSERARQFATINFSAQATANRHLLAYKTALGQADQGAIRGLD